MADPVVELIGVSKSYDDLSTPALHSIDLEVEAGESLAIVGPSGSGKSTLLNIIGALTPPTTGVVRVNGAALDGLDANQLAAFRNQSIGFVFQSHHLLPQCSALENALVPALVAAAETRATAMARAESLLERIGLKDRLHHRPAQLSGGECQRVAVVRALINEPAVLLADEPTGSLDAESAGALAELLVELNETQGVTLITVTHSNDLARRMGRRVALTGGRMEPPGA